MKYDNAKKNILLIPPIIKGGEIFDLSPNNSFVNFLQDLGYNTNIMEFVLKPESNLADYAQEIANFSKNSLSDKPVILIGYCLGGIIALLSSVKNPEYFEKLILINTPLNFKETAISKFISDLINNNENIFNNIPYISSRIISQFFYLISPNQHLKNDDISIKTQKWLDHDINIPSKLASEIIYEIILNNKIYNGEFIIWDKFLKNYIHKIPITNIYSLKDKIVPPNSAKNPPFYLNIHEFIELDTGHLGVFVGKSSKVYWQKIAKAIQELVSKEYV